MARKSIPKNISWNPAAQVQIATERRAKLALRKVCKDLPPAVADYDNNFDKIQDHLQVGNLFSTLQSHTPLKWEIRYGFIPLMPMTFGALSSENMIPRGALAIFFGMKRFTENGRKNKIIYVNRPLMMINGVVYVMMSCLGLRYVD